MTQADIEPIGLHHGQIRRHRYGDADATADFAFLVALLLMALQAGLFHQQGAHEAQITLAFEPFQAGVLMPALLELLQGACLPGIGRIGWAQWVETGDVGPYTLGLPAKFMHLPGHVGRIDQGEPLAPGRFESELAVRRDLSEVRIGRVALGYPCIDAAMLGIPAAINGVFGELGTGGDKRGLAGELTFLTDIGQQRQADGKGPGKPEQQGENIMSACR